MKLVFNIHYADIRIVQSGELKDILCDHEENDAIAATEAEIPTGGGYSSDTRTVQTVPDRLTGSAGRD